MFGRLNWVLVRQFILWLGLLLCGYALWRARTVGGDAINKIGLLGGVIAGGLLLITWLLAVAAWRSYLLVYTDQNPGWRTAMRQVGLLLMGKYVPGGVFGFVARLYDQPAIPRRKLFWAGLAEQAVGVGMSSALGGVLLLVARTQGTTWLSLTVLLPAVSIFGLSLLHHLAWHFPWVRQNGDPAPFPPWPSLLPPVLMHLLQLLVWVALIVMLAVALYGLDSYAALGIAGAFLIAVGAGMLAVIVPGGIGVREAVFVGLALHWLDVSHAVLLAAILRLLVSVLDIISGLVAMWLAPRSSSEWS